MPPKKKKPTNRKTRAQKEEERIAREAEETRLRLLHEETERKLLLRRQATARRELVRLRKSEAERFAKQTEVWKEWHDEWEVRRKGMEAVEEEEKRWKEVLECVDGNECVELRANTLVADLEDRLEKGEDEDCAILRWFCDEALRLEHEVDAMYLDKMANAPANAEIVYEGLDAQFQEVVKRHEEAIARQKNRCLADDGPEDGGLSMVYVSRSEGEPSFSLDVVRIHAINCTENADSGADARAEGNNQLVEGTFANAEIRFQISASSSKDAGRMAIRFGRNPFDPCRQNRFIRGEGRSDTIVVGGMYELQIISLQSPPKTVGPTRVRLLLDGAMEDEGTCIPSETISTPIECTIAVPTSIVPTDSIAVACLDEDCTEWTTEPITDTRYDRTKNSVTFCLSCPRAELALVLPRTVDLPYRNWSVGPVFEDHSCGTERSTPAVDFRLITARRIELVIRIRGAKCILTKPNDLPQLSHLYGVPLSPGELLYSLSNCGIHLLPSYSTFGRDEAEEDGNKTMEGKDPILNEKFSEDVGPLAMIFAVHASVYNEGLGRRQGVYRLKESSSSVKGGAVDPFPMQLLLMETDDTTVVEMEMEDVMNGDATEADGVGISGCDTGSTTQIEDAIRGDTTKIAAATDVGLIGDEDATNAPPLPDPTLSPNSCGMVRCRLLDAVEYDHQNPDKNELDTTTIKEGTDSSISPLLCLSRSGALREDNMVDEEESAALIAKVKDLCPLVSCTTTAVLKLVKPFGFCCLEQGKEEKQE